MGSDHDAGYGKPPRHSRFKKGQSGNPKGRPRGSRNFSTDLKATLEEPTRVTHHGKAQTVSTQHAALMRLREKALGGEVRALDSLIELARLYNDEEMAEAAIRLSATDAEILEARDAKVLRQAGMAKTQSGTRKRRETRQGNDAANGDSPEQDDDDGQL